MGAPVGNKNATKQTRMLSDALRRELTQDPEKVRRVALKLLSSAEAGEPWAQNLIWERVDGKIPQDLDMNLDASSGLLAVLAGLGPRDAR